MPAFPRNPFTSWQHGQTHRLLKKHPSIFGLPFLLLIVGSSFALQPFAQARYDLQDKKITAVSKEQQLKLEQSKKKFDLREAYFNIQEKPEEDWNPEKRIPRPKGLPEWGVAPSGPPAKPSS
ncbi:unnamed protein product [Peniophora sp. CBMAI 1063]|nr:unnamed protein product [Peniophora sp. CBMAI 1063]